MAVRCSTFDSNKIEYDLSPLNEALQENDFKRIATDTHLFWLAFCKAVVSSDPSITCFTPLRRDIHNDNIVHFTGAKWASKALQDIAEKLRVYFEVSYESSTPVEIPANLFTDTVNAILPQLATMLDRDLEQISGSFVLKPKSSIQ